MYICELRVDGYGALHGVTVSFDRPLTVVLGPNEAGKSTLLRFVRSMLYGFPTRKEPVERGEPVNGGRHGGSLLIRTADGRRLLITRYADGGKSAGRLLGSLIVREADEPGGGGGCDDAPLSWNQQMLEKLVLGGVSERLFRQLFAITLDELNELLALQGEEIGSYLYQKGLAGGAMLADARRRLAAEMDKLYRPRGNAQEINRVLAQIRELEDEIRQGRASLEEYEAKLREMERVSQSLEELALKLPQLEAEEARIRAALGCREWWLKEKMLREEERELTERLANPAAPVLGEEDHHAWEALLGRRGEAAARLEKAMRELGQLLADRAALQWDEALLAHQEELEKLEAKRAICAVRQEELQAARAELKQAAEQAEMLAGRISPYWRAEDLARLPAMAGEREALRRLQQDWMDAANALRNREAEAERLERQKEALRAQAEQAAAAGEKAQASGVRAHPKTAGVWFYAAASITAAAVLLLAGAAWGEWDWLPGSAAPALTAAAIAGAAGAAALGARHIRRRERAKALAEAERLQFVQLERERTALAAAMDREARRAERLRAEWEAVRQRYRLPASLTPADLPELFLAAEQGHSALRRLEASRQREAELARELERFCEEAERLFAACPPPAYLQADPMVAVAWLHGRLKEQQAVLAEAQKLDAAIRGAESAVQEAREALQAAEKEMARLLAAAGEKDEAAMAARLQIDARRREFQRERRELKLRLEAGRTPEQVRRIIGLLESEDAEALALKLKNAEEALDGARREHARLLEQKGRLAQALNHLSQEAEREDARIRLAERESRLAELAERYAVLALGDRLLQKTKAVFEAERQPEVLRLASRLFYRMTAGAYARIFVPVDTMQVQAVTNDGRAIDSPFLSRGTREQLYLAMRLALAETVSRDAPLPLVLDDLFVHFDRERLLSTLPVLEDISSRRQVIVLTCHPHIAEAIGRHLPSAGTVRLEGRAAGVYPAFGPGSSNTAR